MEVPVLSIYLYFDTYAVTQKSARFKKDKII